MRLGKPTYISAEQRINSKGAALTLIIGPEHDKHIFDTDHQRKRPDDERENAEEVIVARLLGEGRGVDIEGRSANVTVYNANGLVNEPKGKESNVRGLYSSSCRYTLGCGGIEDAYQSRYFPLKCWRFLISLSSPPSADSTLFSKMEGRRW